jgi:cyclomaltodextrinase / maltogenic alpha-amylase / neopullulanase
MFTTTALVGLSVFMVTQTPTSTTAQSMAKRAKDWRNGAVVYAVFVDRFVPPADVEKAKSLYETPRVFKKWEETPVAKGYSKEAGVWAHEIEFWGGDLQGVISKLDYVKSLGADVLFMNPIHHAYTNHKYDAIDYKQIDPGYGTLDDLKRLIKGAHDNQLKVVLDGVFNHMGRRSPYFQKALKDPKSPYRDWFYFGNEYAEGYKGWAGAMNLAVTHAEHPAFQKYAWEASDAVVPYFLKLGVDGWRLDVAYELGLEINGKITEAAHKAKKGSWVVGEIQGYPAGWFPQLDGQYNFLAPWVCMEMLRGNVSGRNCGEVLNDWVADATIEHALKSWMIVDSHDTPRLTAQLPNEKDRMMMLALHMMLPGSPFVYYGTELGMLGGGDPENRAPMRWDLMDKKNKTLAWIKSLIAMRKKLPALRYGNFQALRTESLLAFTRTTDKMRDTVIVIANPTDRSVTETFSHRIGSLMSWQPMQDQLSKEKLVQKSGLVTIEVPPKTVRIFTPLTPGENGFSPYDRIK